MTKFFVDGCFDSYHYAHVYLLYQAKQLCDELIVGTHSDKEMELHKNKPLNSFEDRKYMLKYCKYINKVIEESVNYITNSNTLEKYGCEKFVHGYESVFTKNNIDALQEIKESGKYIAVSSTSGISTTNLIYRIKCNMDNIQYYTCIDTVYLKNILDKIEYKTKIDIYEHNLYVISDYDMFNRNHLETLVKLKDENPLHKIIAVIKRDDNINYIYNNLEVAIILNSINVIYKVINNEELQKITKNSSKCNLMYELNVIYKYPDFTITSYEEKYNKELSKIQKYVSLKRDYIDTNIYNNILQTQFENLNNIIKTIIFKDSDIIVFDIDEVVLSNLPYINNYMYSYLTTKENIDSGFCLLIKECRLLFNTIHDKNINYAFITGRKEYLRDITINNLESVDIKKYKVLYMCPDNYVGDVHNFKKSCRIELSKKYNIVYNIGDQLSDLIGGYSEQEYLIFNPFYKTN